MLFQLQIISPLILIQLHYSPKIGMIFTSILIIISCFFGILPKLLGLPIAPFEVSEMVSVDQIKKSFLRFFKAEQFLTPFVTGILIGFLIANKENFSKFFNKKFISIILWLLFPLLCSSAIIWGENFKDINTVPNKPNLLLWISLGKILWSLGCGSLILVLYIRSEGLSKTIYSEY
jgi:hypothetical protein